MRYSYARLGVLATLSFAGCSANNPLFEVSSGSVDATGSGEGSTSVTPTSDPLTSTTGPGTTGPGTTGPGTTGPGTSVADTSVSDTSQMATSVEPETTGSSGVMETGTGSGGTGEPVVCGDGVVSEGEECDDGNIKPDDGCSQSCMNELSCGNGVMENGEECDDGEKNGPNQACLGTCQNNICGDGDQGPEEECDLGGDNSDMGFCTSECVLPVCGDNLTNGDESCDDGMKNGNVPGFCSDDCKDIVPAGMLKIQVLENMSGNFKNFVGIAGGDKACAMKFGLGYKVMAVDGVARVASLGPNEGGSNNWVLAPYRAYSNAGGSLVFITGKEALLGVRKKLSVPLINPIGAAPVSVWTGMDKTWQANGVDCGDWANLQVTGAVGVANAKNMGEFIGGAAKNCVETLAIYCVQPPA